MSAAATTMAEGIWGSCPSMFTYTASYEFSKIAHGNSFIHSTSTHSLNSCSV